MDDAALRGMDWYRWYGPLATRPASDQIFLADAVHIVGKAMCMPWDEMFPIHAMLPDPVSPSIPGIAAAFVHGVPVAEVHSAFGAIVRDVLADANARYDSAPASLADFEAGRRVRRQAMDDRALKRDEWEDALLDDEMRLVGRGARSALRVVANAITHLAHAGLVKTYVRPIAGGLELPLMEREQWSTAEPMWRLASCGLSLADAFDPAAEVTHHIFVDRDDLAAHLGDYARSRAVSIPTPGLHPEDRQHYERNEPLIKRTVVELDAICATDPERAWRRDDLMEALSKTPLGTIQINILDAARQELAHKYPKLLQGGAPRGPRTRSASMRDVR